MNAQVKKMINTTLGMRDLLKLVIIVLLQHYCGNMELLKVKRYGGSNAQGVKVDINLKYQWNKERHKWESET